MFFILPKFVDNHVTSLTLEQSAHAAFDGSDRIYVTNVRWNSTSPWFSPLPRPLSSKARLSDFSLELRRTDIHSSRSGSCSAWKWYVLKRNKNLKIGPLIISYLYNGKQLNKLVLCLTLFCDHEKAFLGTKLQKKKDLKMLSNLESKKFATELN